MFTKIRIVLAVVLFAVAIFYTVREGHAENTNPVDSIRILTNIYMKLDFTDAARLRMEKDEETFKKDYYQNQKRILALGLNELKLYLNDEQMQLLADACLTLNNKRDVQVAIVSQEDKKARVKVTISTFDHNRFNAKLLGELERTIWKTSSTKQSTLEVLNALINVYETYEPKDKTNSFEIDCEKYTLSTMQIGKAAFLDRLISGTCWLPSNMEEYEKKLNLSLLQ